MEEETTMEKKNFFQRLKISIFGVERYTEFLNEKTSKAVKYFLLIILIITLIIGGITFYNYSKLINTGISYIKNELPDFEFVNGEFISSENVDAYDSNYDFKFVINTDENLSEDAKNEIINNMKNYTFGVFVDRNSVKLYSPTLVTEAQESGSVSTDDYLVGEYPFATLLSNYSTSNKSENTVAEVTNETVTNIIDTESVVNETISQNEVVENQTSENTEDVTTLLNKEFLITLINNSLIYVYVTIILVIVLVYYLAFLLRFLMDVVILSIVGEIYNSAVNLKIKYSKIFALAIYSMTLPIVIDALINVLSLYINCSSDIVDSLYFIIGIIYMIAALSIMKSGDKLGKQDVGPVVEEIANSEQSENNMLNDSDKQEDSKDKQEDSQDKKESNEKPDEPDGSEI